MEEWTESTQSSKKFNIDDIYRDYKEFLRGIPVVVNPLVPKGEIWCVNNKQEIYRIINVGNSKLYRFINWYQKLFKR